MPHPLSRRALLISAGGLIAMPGTAALAWDSTYDPEADPTISRRMIFEDQFATIDPAVWSAGRKATTFDSGYYGRSAFAGIEGAEGFNPYAIVDDPETENGKALRISARYIGRQMEVPGYYGNDDPEYQWISGNLQSARPDGTILKGWRRGYFEARMRFPAHPLTWPAFWLLNARSILTSRTSVEVDVVEHKGFEPHQYGAYLHEWGEPGERHTGSGVETEEDLTEGYNRYGVLLARNRCIIYFNRQPIRDPATGKPQVWLVNRSAELDVNNDRFWPLLTLALLHDVPYPDPLRPEDHEAHMLVDYFRVFA
ncbi:glycosyl hydrolase family protein [Sinirhodobacter populi]|uniref:Glycosyl hydrolase family protein n=1 Tax=Paenirhodobacter populi TaxID=2306993 RepID=A0A443KLR8_9RHOB|nr:family 16 glycosylhydrolase [Sinirhodobacter populi]RWR33772.1 glycosyl hydrolase family protein [Sinirhodobacter populi]